MATLTLPDKRQTLADAEAIRTWLADRGILYARWQARHEFTSQATQEEILAAYDHALGPYMARHGYRTADVISVHADTPNIAELQAKFLREHIHTEDEVRFFVDGRGWFWFHLDDAEIPDDERVFCVECAAGDLLSVPAGYKHWFDMGARPFVKVIRVFTDVSGWTPHYTNSGVEGRYESLAGRPS